MKKWKTKVLLTVVLVLTAILTVLSFARFPVGTKDFNGFLGAIETDYDISGGTAYTLKLAKENTEDVKDVEEVIDTLKTRLDLLGYENYSVKAVKDVDDDVKDYDIVILARGDVNRYGEVDSVTLSQDIQVAAAYGELKFFGGAEESPTEEILKDGDVVADAYYGGSTSYESETYYQINIVFSDYGYEEIKNLMGENSYYLNIKVGDTSLTGDKGLEISPSTFNKEYQLTTTSGEAMARQFALQIKTGGLAYNYEVDSGVVYESAFGKNADVKCVIALSALMVAIIVAMFILNKKFGLIFCLSAILFVDLYLFLLIAIPGIKVSLGGVLGFALAELLLADGFVITTNRIKEEFAHGKTVKSAVKTGFARSLKPILGVAGIAVASALILFALSFGAIKNFAFVFAVGAFLAAATSTLFTRMFAKLILTLAEYKEDFLGFKRDDVNEQEGE